MESTTTHTVKSMQSIQLRNETAKLM